MAFVKIMQQKLDILPFSPANLAMQFQVCRLKWPISEKLTLAFWLRFSRPLQVTPKSAWKEKNV